MNKIGVEVGVSARIFPKFFRKILEPLPFFFIHGSVSIPLLTGEIHGDLLQFPVSCFPGLGHFPLPLHLFLGLLPHGLF